MGAAGVDFGGAVPQKGVGDADKGAGSIDFIVDGQSAHAFDFADDVESLGGIRVAYAPLFDDSQWCIELSCHIAGMCGYADIGGDDYQVIQYLLFLFPVIAEYEESGEFVNRYVEEALNLGGVKVYG